ncbi:MAG TPA: flavin reductase family protein, partial [Ktedonobacteraceae bacterium]|nr:flavin reductase family protein [Ktedonobacteraceae bacterium]
MALDTDFFRKVMGQFATGVTIATTRAQAGTAGLTVNSFASVSLRPLLILICVDLRSQALPFLRESGIFAVNILAQEQEALSNGFASSTEERYMHFCHAEYAVAATGAPILAGTMGFVDARVTAEYPGGDHVILLGQVEAMGYNGQVFFMPGISDSQSTLPSVDKRASSNGHAQAEGDQRSPLLYYRGMYHHLSSHYRHAHPELAPLKKA